MRISGIFVLIHFGRKSFSLSVTGYFNLTNYDQPIVENDKIRQQGRDKFCAETVGRNSPRWNFGQDERNCGFRIAECGIQVETLTSGASEWLWLVARDHKKASDHRPLTTDHCILLNWRHEIVGSKAIFAIVEECFARCVISGPAHPRISRF